MNGPFSPGALLKCTDIAGAELLFEEVKELLAAGVEALRVEERAQPIRHEEVGLGCGQPHTQELLGLRPQ